MKKLRSIFFPLLLLPTSFAIVSCSDDDPAKKQVPTDGLIAEYLFNGNGDDSKGDLNGTVNGATLTTDRHGKTNAAYKFDGDDYISILDDGTLNFASDQDFTISLWISVSATQNDETAINDILRKWTGNSAGYPYAIAYLNSTSGDYANEIMAVRYDGQTCENGPSIYSSPISADQFTHIVYMKEGSVLTLMINGNGSLISTTTDNTETGVTCGTENDSHITLGCRGQLVRFFQGKIDDVRFYNRALSMDEIGQLYDE